MKKIAVARYSDLQPLTPTAALVSNTDLVVIRHDDGASVLYGRCLHRGALLADGHVDGDNLICGLHGWDYRFRSGISEYKNEERLPRFSAWVENDTVLVDQDEVRDWERENPQPYKRDTYLGQYADVHGAPEEPFNREIQNLARFGLSKVGHHGPVSAMGSR